MKDRSIMQRLRIMGSIAAAAPFFLEGLGGPSRIVGKRMRPLDWSKPHQGAGEIARRRRQIELGQLTESNGLVKS